MDPIFAVLFSLIVTVLCSEDPYGHKKPLGSHTKSWNIDVLDDFPNPTEFYHDYVKTGRPVLFKGVLNSGGFPAYQKWTDDYLSEKYGSEYVEIEEGKKETRTGGVRDNTLSDFLKTYVKEDVYMVQDLFPQMQSEIGIPRCLQCGGFQNQIWASIMWFSSGGTKSVLHLDTYDNINCLFDGKKDLVMFDKAYQGDIEADEFFQDGSYSAIDVDSVDLYKTPRFSFIPWFKATMNKGDCLYIPFKWYHQVNSFGSRNLAVNIWFNHLLWFNDTDCGKETELKQFVPLSEIKMASDSETIRHALLSFFDGSIYITPENLREGWGQVDDLFSLLDLNKDSKLTWEEMYRFDINDVISRYGKYLLNIDESLWLELEQIVLRSARKGNVDSIHLLKIIHKIMKHRNIVTTDESENDMTSHDDVTMPDARKQEL